MKKKRGLRAKPTANSAPHEEAERAFVRFALERQALEPGELVRPTVDVPRAVGAVLASLPAIVELLPEMKRLPGFDANAVEDLRDVALAAEYASAVYPPAPRDRSLTELADEAKALEQKLLAQARALAETGLLDATAVSAIRPSRKHGRVASNLTALATLFRQSWREVEGRTRVDEQAVERAGVLGVELLEALGSRETKRPAVGAAADARNRAFTLLLKQYDQVRRAISFVRWNEGDADAIAPSIYLFRSARRPPSRAETEAPAEAPAATPPAVTP